MSQLPPTSVPTTGGYAEAHRGVLVLVLGILSIVLCQLLGPFAWLMGKKDLEKINAGTMDPEGRGLTQAGMICGLIGSILLAIWVVMMLLWFLLVILLGVGAAAAGAAGSP